MEQDKQPKRVKNTESSAHRSGTLRGAVKPHKRKTEPSAKQIIDDYMETYDNYYKITLEKDPAKYQVIKEKNADAMLKFICGSADIDLDTADLSAAARNYLLKAGMSDAQIDAFLDRITE